MKKKTLFLCLLALSSTFTACNDDSSDGASGDTTNQNANPSVIPNAANLEMPRLDDQTGDIYSHYVTYNGTRVLNYTVDWHKEKKHSRWVAFIFTNTTAGTSWNRNNWKGTEWNGTVWEGDPFQADPDIPAGERTELEDYRGSGYNRGHLCASADRLFSKDANGQTFYLSNMSPQMGRFNQDDWVDLEGQVQNWGRNSSFRDTLFVVKGGTTARLKHTPEAECPSRSIISWPCFARNTQVDKTLTRPSDFGWNTSRMAVTPTCVVGP